MPDVVQSADWNRINNMPSIGRAVGQGVDLYNMFKPGGTEDQRRAMLAIAQQQAEQAKQLNQANIGQIGAQTGLINNGQLPNIQASTTGQNLQNQFYPLQQGLSLATGEQALSKAAEDQAANQALRRAGTAASGWNGNPTPPASSLSDQSSLGAPPSNGGSFSAAPPPANTKTGNNPDVAATSGMTSGTESSTSTDHTKIGPVKPVVPLSSPATSSQAPVQPVPPPAGVPAMTLPEGGVPGSEKYNAPAPGSGNPPVSLPPIQDNHPQLESPNSGQNPAMQNPPSGGLPLGQQIPPNPQVPNLQAAHFANLPPEQQQQFLQHLNQSQPPGSPGFTYADAAQSYEQMMASRIADPMHPIANQDLMTQFTGYGQNGSKYLLPNGTFDLPSAISDRAEIQQRMFGSMLGLNNGQSAQPGQGTAPRTQDRDWEMVPDGKGGLTAIKRDSALVRGDSGLPRDTETKLIGVADKLQSSKEYQEFNTASEAMNNIKDAYQRSQAGDNSPQNDAQIIASISKLDNPGGVLRLSIAELMEHNPGVEGWAQGKSNEITGLGALTPFQRTKIAEVAGGYIKNVTGQYNKVLNDKLSTARKLTGGEMPDSELKSWLVSPSDQTENSPESQPSIEPSKGRQHQEGDTNNFNGINYTYNNGNWVAGNPNDILGGKLTPEQVAALAPKNGTPQKDYSKGLFGVNR